MTSKRGTAEPIEVDASEPEPDLERAPLMDRLEHLGHNVTDFVVQRPLTAVGIAVGVGFLLGRAMRRW